MGGPRLPEKVALITGSSSGVGRAIALLFASEGTSLIVCADLKSEAAQGADADADYSTHELICKNYGEGKAVYVRTDVGVGEDVERAVGFAVEKGGRLDIMVNNAGLGAEGIKIHELEEDVWDKMIRVNLRSVYLGCKFACRQFLKQDLTPSGHRGFIVNTASILGLVGFSNGAAGYCASKGGIVNLTKQVAIDYARDRIHCNALCPGFTKTAMTSALFNTKEDSDRLMNLTPWGTWGDKDDVAKGALFLASEDAAWVTGVALPVDGGMLAQ